MNISLKLESFLKEMDKQHLQKQTEYWFENTLKQNLVINVQFAEILYGKDNQFL